MSERNKKAKVVKFAQNHVTITSAQGVWSTYFYNTCMYRFISNIIITNIFPSVRPSVRPYVRPQRYAFENGWTDRPEILQSH